MSRAGSLMQTVRAAVARRPLAWGIGAFVALLVLASGSTAAIAVATAPRREAASGIGPTSTAPALSPSASATPTPATTPTATAQPTPSSAAAPAKPRTCTVDAAAGAPGLGDFHGFVLDAATGETLFDRKGSDAAATGSVMKTLTTATALADLGASYRIPTTVTNEGGGAIAIVGHGDPTLSQGGATVYPGAPTLAQLAAQVKTALGSTPITRIDTDDTYWNDADAWTPDVPESERTIGYQPLITALMVDGDRANPALATSPRSTDPVGRAGSLFRTALVNAGVTGASTATIVKRATTSQTVIASVQSQPISTLIGQMIPNSDNTLAEMLARISSVRAGGGGSAASLTSVYSKALSSAYGLSVPAGFSIRDGSGESPNNAVTPALVAQLMVQVHAGTHGLGVLAGALPVSGETGTLASRFTGANAIARGKIHAKTGWIDNVETLGGYMTAADGTVLTFGFFAEGAPLASALPALDTISTAVYSCGGNLSNG